MSLSEVFLGCLTFIELVNLFIRVVKIATMINDYPPELTDEMRKRLYS